MMKVDLLALPKHTAKANACQLNAGFDHLAFALGLWVDLRRE